MNKVKKRKICVVIASRANYARVKYLMKAIKNNKNLTLQIIVGASSLLHKYGKAIDVIVNDGFKPDFVIHYLIEGENLVTQVKSTGMGVIELSTAFQKLEPDIVISVADRFETMATAIASSYMNIPLAHIQGGEVSGNIDDSVRHAITKLAHIHFPATKKSAKRIENLGEEKWRIFNYGCPSIDTIRNLNKKLPSTEYFKNKGTGVPFDPNKPYIIVLQHPVTTSLNDTKFQIQETLEAAKLIDINKIVMWPNPDAGSSELSKMIRDFQNIDKSSKFSYFTNFPPEIFVKLIYNASCLIGNSSSFIREGSFLGKPAVIIGERQEGREHAENVIFSKYCRKDILSKINIQLKRQKIKKSFIFGKGDAGIKIAKKLENVKLKIVKKITY